MNKLIKITGLGENGKDGVLRVYSDEKLIKTIGLGKNGEEGVMNIYSDKKESSGVFNDFQFKSMTLSYVKIKPSDIQKVIKRIFEKNYYNN